MLITRIESGSHRFTYLTLWPTRQSGCDPHMTHILKFLFKVMQNDMKQCHRFLCSWQDTELVSCTDFLKMKFLNTTDFKTAWGIKLVSDQCGSVHSPDPRFTHVSDANVFSKGHMWPGVQKSTIWVQKNCRFLACLLYHNLTIYTTATKSSSLL